MAELTQIKSVDSRKLSNKRSRSDYVFDNQSFTDDKSNGIEHTVNIRTVDEEYTDDTDSTDSTVIGCCENTVVTIQLFITSCLKGNSRLLKNTFLVTLFLLYFAYFGYSLYYRFGDEGSYRLLIATVLAAILLAWNMTSVTSTWSKNVCDCCSRRLWARKRARWLLSFYLSRLVGKPTMRFANRSDTNRAVQAQKMARGWLLKLAVVAGLLVYIVIDVAIDSPKNLISLAGLAVFIIIFFITSTNPSKVNWHPIFWGISIQYIFALVILRTSWGYDAFEWVGDRVTEFIENAQAGSEFVFGPLPKQHIFAFFVMPVVVFFCSVIAILYHFGVMQAIIRTIGRILAFGLGTTPAESLNVAGNMFVSQSEALALINPFLKDMTQSELHAALTGGFASVSGSTLGAYIGLGVPANHLLTATVMSAPAALAMSKLSCPETEVSKASSDDFYKIGTEKVNNVIEAAYQGANQSIKLVANICINLMAFLAILKFLNNTLTWFGDRAGVDNLTFEYICSYVMYPVAYLMGVDSENCRKVAELIGIKTFLNEFIAYTTLGELVENRVKFEEYTTMYNTTDSWHYRENDIFLKYWNETLTGGVMTKRSEAVATYALCGYSNIGSIGINLGALLAFAPSRRVDAPRLVVRAMICGSAACFLTGAVAGLLYKDF